MFENLARRIRLAVESRVGARLPHRHPIMYWLIEWVGGAHNRFKEGQDDGRTARERAGFQAQSIVLEFGEKVYFVPFESHAKVNKFEAKLKEGVWLGLDSQTDEHIIGTKIGVFRSNSPKPLPEDQR